MKLTNKTILVTGGAGFIGSHFVEVTAKNHNVIVYDNFSSNVVTPKELLAYGVRKVIRGDILDRKTLAQAMKKIDVVLHFAAACVRLSLSQERLVHDINATGTLNTLLAAKNAGVKRYIYISSSEIYGTAEKKLMDEHHPITPTTVYGMSKYIGELYTKHFHDIQGLPTMIIRPFNSYGSHGHFESFLGEAIPRFVVRALNGKQAVIFGTGKQTRDFTYVYDTVDGIVKALQCDKLLGDCVNIAYGKEVTIAKIANIICKQTGLPFRPIMKPARPHDVERHAANTGKAKRMLGYTPQVSVEEGISIFIDWMKKTYPAPEKLLKRVPNTNW
jgi:UDP-glucose 4-epimerase